MATAARQAAAANPTAREMRPVCFCRHRSYVAHQEPDPLSLPPRLIRFPLSINRTIYRRNNPRAHGRAHRLRSTTRRLSSRHGMHAEMTASCRRQASPVVTMQSQTFRWPRESYPVMWYLVPSACIPPDHGMALMVVLGRYVLVARQGSTSPTPSDMCSYIRAARWLAGARKAEAGMPGGWMHVRRQSFGSGMIWISSARGLVASSSLTDPNGRLSPLRLQCTQATGTKPFRNMQQHRRTWLREAVFVLALRLPRRRITVSPPRNCQERLPTFMHLHPPFFPFTAAIASCLAHHEFACL